MENDPVATARGSDTEEFNRGQRSNDCLAEYFGLMTDE